MNDNSSTAVLHGITYASITSGPQFFVDGVEHTADDVRDLKAELKHQEDIANRLRDNNHEAANEIHIFKAAVRSAFTELVEDGDLAKAKANEALGSLLLDPLPSRYRGTVTVEFEIEFETELTDESAIADALTDSTFEMGCYSSEIDDLDADANVGEIQVEVDE